MSTLHSCLLATVLVGLTLTLTTGAAGSAEPDSLILEIESPSPVVLVQQGGPGEAPIVHVVEVGVASEQLGWEDAGRPDAATGRNSRSLLTISSLRLEADHGAGP